MTSGSGFARFAYGGGDSMNTCSQQIEFHFVARSFSGHWKSESYIKGSRSSGFGQIRQERQKMGPVS